jgi:glucose/arabinose dehydrogenase
MEEGAAGVGLASRCRGLLAWGTFLAGACVDGRAPIEPEPVTGLRAVQVVTGLSSPVHLTAPAGDARLFVVEQPGRIRIIRDGALVARPFLDITADVGSGGERGLLSVAFDPAYATNGFFYVNYTDLAGDTRIERYRVSADADLADAASAKLILAIEQPYSNHNGGLVAFGPDGMLYIGMGDGGDGGDPHNHGQDRGTLLGDLLRIDVRTGDPYGIPANNPFRNDPAAKPEIWAYGLRNPWRFSFDPPSGLLFVADVGQNQWEEINAVTATTAGVNYGWRVMEGRHCYNASSCNRNGLLLPVHEYTHDNGCSVTGGHVYRGSRLTGLQGHYFYSDYCDGSVRSLRVEDGRATDHRVWSLGSLGSISSFGVDATGELYIVSHGGRVYRIEPEPTG